MIFVSNLTYSQHALFEIISVFSGVESYKKGKALFIKYSFKFLYGFQKFHLFAKNVGSKLISFFSKNSSKLYTQCTYTLRGKFILHPNLILRDIFTQPFQLEKCWKLLPSALWISKNSLRFQKRSSSRTQAPRKCSFNAFESNISGNWK